MTQSSSVNAVDAIINYVIIQLKTLNHYLSAILTGFFWLPHHPVWVQVSGVVSDVQAEMASKYLPGLFWNKAIDLVT